MSRFLDELERRIDSMTPEELAKAVEESGITPEKAAQYAPLERMIMGKPMSTNDIMERLNYWLANPRPGAESNPFYALLQDAKAEIERLRSPMPKSQMRRLAVRAPEKVQAENERLRVELARMSAVLKATVEREEKLHAEAAAMREALLLVRSETDRGPNPFTSYCQVILDNALQSTTAGTKLLAELAQLRRDSEELTQLRGCDEELEAAREVVRLVRKFFDRGLHFSELRNALAAYDAVASDHDKVKGE